MPTTQKTHYTGSQCPRPRGDRRQPGMALEAVPTRRTALRLQLASGECAIPLERAYYVAPFATLTGEPDDCFAGWLTFHGHHVPVFDLNRVVCDQPTPERFGSRI